MVVASTIRLGYRTVFFEVDADWLSEYLLDFAEMYKPGAITATTSHGMVSSIGDSLDVLWYPFRSAAKGSHDTFHDLIGCYNLPQTYRRAAPLDDAETVATPSWAAGEKPDLFWHLDWGPAHKVLMYALQLVYTYSEHVESDSTSEDCDGLRAFVEKLLQGKKATNKVDSTCSLSISFRNEESVYPLVNEACRAIRDCEDGYRRKEGGYEPGLEHDDYALSWNTAADCVHGSSYDDASCSAPQHRTTTGAYASVGRFEVTSHPITLHFRGAVCDYILFLARLAWDYAIHGDLDWLERVDLIVSAVRIARYALRIISSFGELLVHEIGHLFIGTGGHCSADSCMSIAGSHWGCKVRGALGLPSRVFSRKYESPYLDTDDDWDVSDNCLLNSSAHHFRWDACFTVQEGVPGQDAIYCSTGCLKDCAACSGSCDKECDVAVSASELSEELVSLFDCMGDEAISACVEGVYDA